MVSVMEPPLVIPRLFEGLLGISIPVRNDLSSVFL